MATPARAAVSFAFVLLARCAPAQCTWFAGDAAGPPSYVRCSAFWDPDGGGPLPSQFVVGGGVTNGFVYIWDGANWSPVGGTFAGGAGGVRTVLDYQGSLVAGGIFTTVAGQTTSQLAIWDGIRWQALGGGVNGQVDASVVYQNSLVVGGLFTSAGGASASRIASWNGAKWAALGAGLNGSVHALEVIGSDLIVAGAFTVAGGAPAAEVARWNGVQWSSMGGGMSGGPVRALALHNGDLIAGGGFTQVEGSTPAAGIARWDGTRWNAIGAGLGTAVLSLQSVSGLLYAGGSFTTPQLRVAQWDGSAWLPVGGGLDQPVFELATLNGTLFVGGQFDSVAGVSNTAFAALWDGQQWAGFPLTALDEPVNALLTLNGALYAGGQFVAHRTTALSHVAIRAADAWSPVGAGFDGDVRALAAFDSGAGDELYAGGQFQLADNSPAANIARWDGAAWHALTSGTDGSVNTMAVWDDGGGPDLYIGGAFTNAGTTSAAGIARWGCGASPCAPEWRQTFRAGDFDGAPLSFAWFDEGAGPSLFAAGAFTRAGGIRSNHIARWNGSQWTPLAAAGANGDISSMVVYDDGAGAALYVAGEFTTIGAINASYLARWNGVAWNAVPGVFGGISCCSPPVATLAVYDDGAGPALYVGGEFTTIDGAPLSHIARWDGQSWAALGSGLGDEPLAMLSFDDGSGPALFVGGFFSNAGGATANRVARWNGMAWSAVGAGFDDTVYALAAYDAGSGPALYAGGRFSRADGAPATRLAKWSGASWSAVGGGLPRTVNALHAATVGGQARLYVGIDTDLAIYDNLWSFDGTTLAPLPNVVNSHVRALSDRADVLYVGGWFTGIDGAPANKIAAFDGTNWSPLHSSDVGSGLSAFVSALAGVGPGGLVSAPGARLFAGGGFGLAGTTPVRFIAAWNGSSWSPLGSGMNGLVRALAIFDDGSGPVLYAGGQFTSAGGIAASRIARWDGLSWSALGAGVNGTVWALHVADLGSGSALYVAGDFTTAGGQAANHLARWDAAGWHAQRTGLDGSAFALTSQSRVLHVGGDFRTADGLPAAYWARWAELSSDFNDDHVVNESDLGLLLQAFAFGGPGGDADGDGDTDESDLGLLLQSWLRTCP
ncbi:MAG: hypothetical protein U1D55_06635 [Phycisphaerae bacterium]